MKILVTGHKGFIGKNVFSYLQENFGSSNVFGIDRPEGVENFSGGDYGLVVHLAAFANIRESLENPKKFYENNVVNAKKYLIGVEKKILVFFMLPLAQLKKIIGKIHMQ